MDLAPRMVAQLAAALPRAAEAAPYAAAQLAAPYLAPRQTAPQVYGVQAPGVAPGQAPGPVDTFEPTSPGPTNPAPYIALQNPFTENDKWLIPVIAVTAVGIFLGLTAGAVRWARRMGVPIRG